MEITLAELYEGKPTLIKNREFYSTKQYVEPFIERMSKLTNNFVINVQTPDQMTLDNNKEDITFNRVWVQAVLPKEYQIDAHDEVIAFLYGLNVRKPVAKIYRGYLNSACTNLCVFNPNWIQTQEIIPGDPLNYAGVQHLIEDTNDFALKLKSMKETYLDRDDRINMLGRWVDGSLRETINYGYGSVKLAVSNPVKAYTQLFIDSESKYYVPEGIDPTLFDIYNSFTQIITDDKKDILNRFEKTLIVNNLLNVN